MIEIGREIWKAFWKSPILIGTSLLSGLVVWLVVLHSLGYRFNEISSAPIGIYRLDVRSDVKTGDLVLVCLEGEPLRVALERGYQTRRKLRGGCDSGAMPIVKRIIARGGETVDPEIYPSAAFDPLDRPLDRFSAQRVRIPQGQVWISAYHNTPDSYDSRIFGPVSESTVLGRVEFLVGVPTFKLYRDDKSMR